MVALSQEHTLRVPIISEIIGRSIARGKVFVGLYDPSAQWLSLILTIGSQLLRQGYVVGITTLTTQPSQARQQVATALPNLKELEEANKFSILDWYTWMTGRKSTERRSVDSLGLAQFNVQDTRSQREDSPIYDYLAIDNMSAFLKYNDEKAFMQWLDKTLARMKELKGVRLYGFMKHFHSEAFYANLEAMADGVIELDNRDTGHGLENVIRLKGMKGIGHPTDWRVLRTTSTGFLELISASER